MCPAKPAALMLVDRMQLLPSSGQTSSVYCLQLCIPPGHQATAPFTNCTGYTASKVLSSTSLIHSNPQGNKISGCTKNFGILNHLGGWLFLKVIICKQICRLAFLQLSVVKTWVRISCMYLCSISHFNIVLTHSVFIITC